MGIRRSRYLVLPAILLLLSGCASSGDAGPAASPSPTAPQLRGGVTPPKEASRGLSWTKDTSPFVFTQYFYGNWAIQYLWKDQFAMKLIESKTGVRIDRRLAAGNDEDYLNMMIATDSLPDTVMLDWNSPAVSKLVGGGMVYSINELIEKYAPEFGSMLDPEMVRYHSIDGRLWYLPNLYENKDRMTTGKPVVSIRPWFIRKDLYAAIGSPPIRTPEELLGALRSIKRLDPKVMPVGMDFFDVATNGFSGSLSMDYLIYSFAPHLWEERIRQDKRTVEYPMRNAGFINAFRFVNTLYREGLFDTQLLIGKQEQYEERAYNAGYAVASHFLDDLYTRYNPRIAGTLGDSHTYRILDGLEVKGQSPRYPASRLMGWKGFFITKKAADPGRIIRFLEYAWSDEGQMDLRYGKLNETYEIADGLPQLKKDVHDLMLSDKNSWYERYGLEASTLMWRPGQPWDDAQTQDFMTSYPEEYAAAKQIAEHNFDTYNLGIENLEPEGSSPEGAINSKIKSLWNKTIPQLIMSKTDSQFDGYYRDFIKQMDEIGAEKVEKAMYQRHLLDLQKKGL